MSIFVTSDYQFGRTLAAANRGFASVEEMNDNLIDIWNSKITKNDIVYHLGNFAWDSVACEYATAYLNGKIMFIRGKYDFPLTTNSLVLTKRHEIIPDLTYLEAEAAVLSYWPLENWPGKAEESLHLYGGEALEHQISGRFNVNCEKRSYAPIQIDNLVDIYQEILKIN